MVLGPKIVPLNEDGEEAGPIADVSDERPQTPGGGRGNTSAKQKKKSCCHHMIVIYGSVSRQLACNIWNRPIKVIGERFGASVRGFMMFIRTLFWLNFTLAIVWGVLVQLTQLSTFVTSDIDAVQFLIGLFTGTGLERSWFFFSGYGAYSMPTNLTDNVTILDIQHAKPKGLGLSVPESVVTTDVWYLGLAAFSMFYSLYFALHAILDYFGHEHDHPIGSNNYDAGVAVFDAWDFALNDEDAANDNKAKLGGSLKVLRDAHHESVVLGTKTWNECFIFYFRKFIGLTLCLCLVIGSALVIAYMLTEQKAVQKMLLDRAPQLAPFSEFLFPVTLAIINGAVPTLCKIFVKIEKWDNATEVSQLILRVWVIKLLNLLITFATSYEQVGNPERIREKYIAGDYTLSQAESYLCREDYLGMLLWKMAITDMATQILTHSIILRLLFCIKSSVSGGKKQLTKTRQELKVADFCREIGLPFGTKDDMKRSTKICEDFVADQSNNVALEDTADKEWVCEDAVDKAHLANLAETSEMSRASGSVEGEGKGRGMGSESAHGFGKGSSDVQNEAPPRRLPPTVLEGEGEGPVADDDAAEESADRPATAQLASIHLNYYQLAKDKSIVKCKAEFDVPTNIINLMYQQCLIWSGFACAPFLFALGLVGFTLQFWVQHGVLMVRSKAPKSASVGSLYYRFLLATWCFALMPNLFLVINTPSQYCGPFSLASNSNLPKTASIYMTFHYWFISNSNTGSTLVQYWYEYFMYFAFNAIVMMMCVCCFCIAGVFYRAEGQQLNRNRHRSNHMVHTLEGDRNRIMKKVKTWCKKDGGENPHVIPGLSDETVWFIQPLDTPMEDKLDLKKAPYPTHRPNDPNPRGSGMDAEIVSSFWMWRTGRAAPAEDAEKEVMALGFPYNQIEFEDSSDSDQEFDMHA